MDIKELQIAIRWYEEVVAVGCQIRSGGAASRALFEISLASSARLVLTRVQEANGAQIEVPSGQYSTMEEVFASPRLPSLDTLQKIANKLVTAVGTGNKAAAVFALEELGILPLCSGHELQLPRLEIVVSSVPGRAQLIPMVELAIFAAELEDLKSASKFVTEAHGFGPGPSELHDLRSVEGLIALGEGNIARAVSYLRDSIRVCMTDEYACLECSARAPNVMLAKRLFEHGESDEVVGYLAQCRDVWDAHRKQFSTWIDAIKSGEIPQFLASGVLGLMSHPATKMRHLDTMVAFLAEEPRTPTLRSRAEVVARRARLREEFRNESRAAIDGRLNASKN
jgi:hypothetical protein